MTSRLDDCSKEWGAKADLKGECCQAVATLPPNASWRQPATAHCSWLRLPTTRTGVGMGPPTNTALSESLEGRKNVMSSGRPAGSRFKPAGGRRSVDGEGSCRRGGG